MKRVIREILCLCGVFVICFFQSYFAMEKFKDSISAYGFDESYEESISWLSLDVVILYLIVKLLICKFKFKLKEIIYAVFFAFGCFRVNLGIFQSRESAWSTYLLSEEISYTFDMSFIWVCLATIICFIYLKFVSYLFDKY